MKYLNYALALFAIVLCVLIMLMVDEQQRQMHHLSNRVKPSEQIMDDKIRVAMRHETRLNYLEHVAHDKGPAFQ